MADGPEGPDGARQAQRWTEEMEEAYEAAVAEVGGLENAKPRAVLDLMAPKFPELNLQRVKWHLLAHRRRVERHKAMGPQGIAPPTKWAGRMEKAYQQALARLGGLQGATPKPLLEALLPEFPDLTLQVVKCHLQKQRRKHQDHGRTGGGGGGGGGGAGKGGGGGGATHSDGGAHSGAGSAASSRRGDQQAGGQQAQQGSAQVQGAGQQQGGRPWPPGQAASNSHGVQLGAQHGGSGLWEAHLAQLAQTWSQHPPPWQRYLPMAARQKLVVDTRKTLHCRQALLFLEQRQEQLVHLIEELSALAGEGQAVHAAGLGNGSVQLPATLRQQLLHLVPASALCLGLSLSAAGGGALHPPRRGTTRQQRTQAEIAASFTLLQPPSGMTLAGLEPQAALLGMALQHSVASCAVPQCQVCAYERRLSQVRREISSQG